MYNTERDRADACTASDGAEGTASASRSNHLLLLKTTEDASGRKKVQQILFRHAGAVTLHMCAL